MKQNVVRRLLLIVLGLGFLLSEALSQTAGTLTFTANTSAPSGTWGNKHVLAVWLENTANPSVFIKTKAKYGSEDDHLTSWIAKSKSNLVDAVTGATLGSYNPVTITWNGTNVSGTVVPDGNYKIWIEMGWGSNKTDAHAVTSFAFNKGPAKDSQTYTGTTNFSNAVVQWLPLVTLIGATEDFDNVNVFPNPTTGMVNIDFKSELSNASIIVVDASGKAVVNQKDLRISKGTKAFGLCK